MRWRRGAGLDQIEDRRGARLGGLPLPALAGGGGLGGVVLLVLLLLSGIIGGGGGFDVGPGGEGFPRMPAAGEPPLNGAPDPDADLRDFVAFVVDDVQSSWAETFTQAGRRYQPTTLVLFEQQTATGCGIGSAATGPFYCPADSKVYLDLGFFRELRDRFGAPGDFAQAYVIAHEFGHHVQNLLDVDDRVRALQQRSPRDANELSVRQELQADCLAGMWAYSAYRDELLEPGDIREGLDAAAAVGDDRIQRETTGRVNPESWTHGSSRQRTEWFERGYESGTMEQCDSFSGDV